VDQHEFFDQPRLSLWVRTGRRWSSTSAIVTGRIEELTSTTATIDLDARTQSLKLGQAVRARLGTSSTTTIVTEAQPHRRNAETRYVLQFVNTTPAFRTAVRDAIQALTFAPDGTSLKAA